MLSAIKLVLRKRRYPNLFT